MRIRTFALLSLVAVLPAHAQRFSHPVMASRDDASLAPRATLAAPETIRVLAAMVQFSVDNDTRTTGNGQFNLSTQPDSSIDPPPRNARYFSDHLRFLENYYRKASRGKLIVVSTLVDSVYTLPAVMATYSPAKSSSNKPIGDLARDTWTLVDASRRVPDFRPYRAFVVFHAGTGRDVDMTGILGYDPAPLDIPSLYIGPNAFREFYGASYAGIPVQNGAFLITNSMVLPETESRSLPTATGSVPLELGINGLLCSSFGNFLGLPDLFDTKTGRSGIGRFGLMDGAAIFSYSGVFPPEPSAWEKIWLGWIHPVAVGTGTTRLSLPATGLGVFEPGRPDTVYRVPIGPTEYFLVENRNRDPRGDGQKITSVLNGTVREQFYRRDTTGFNASDVSGLSGVITDVEDFDWSLPGGVDENNVWYDGGILIWHVDEEVLGRTLANNTVNADPSRRGVYLEEADGSQDIGQNYGSITAGSGSEQGTALDFWYSGNGSPVNKNLFSGSTFPDSRSNGGALSHVAIQQFSSRGPLMSAVAVVGDSAASPVAGFPRYLGETLAFGSGGGLTVGDVDGDGQPELMIATTGDLLPSPTTEGTTTPPRQESKLFLFRTDSAGTAAGFRKSGVIATSGSDRIAFGSSPALRQQSVASEIVLGGSTTGGSSPGVLRGFLFRDSNLDSLTDNLFDIAATFPANSPPVASESLLAFAGTTGMVKFLRPDGRILDSLAASEGTSGSAAHVSRWKTPNSFVVTADGGNVWITSRDPQGGVTTPDRKIAIGRRTLSLAATGLFPRGALTAFVADGDLYLLGEALDHQAGFPRSGIDAIGSPAFGDIDGDGVRDIVVFGRRSIWAFHDNGAVLDNFPVGLTMADDDTLASAPVIADVNGDNAPDVVAASKKGLVFAIDRSGAVLRGFPLQVGTGRQSVAVVDLKVPVLQGSRIGIAVASESSGTVSAFLTGGATGPVSPTARPWPQFQTDAAHSGLTLDQLIPKPLVEEFFPASRVYNWPNPVYDGKTFIRFFVKEDAKVEVRIFDLAGDLVHEFQTTARGGMDSEIPWDTGNVQSGVYLARVKATGASNEGTRVVKIAVVK